MALGLLIGNDYPLLQIVVATTAVCFGFGFSNPALSAAASNAAGAETMGGALGTVQGFGSLGQVGGMELAGPLYHLGGCLLYTSPSPRDGLLSRMPSSA